MLKINKKVEYALIVLLDLAERNAAQATTAKELSNRYKIPYELLGKVLQSLSRKHLLNSVQGVKGGYVMTRSLQEISIQQVIEAIDGPITLTSCIAASPVNCEQHASCTIRTPMAVIQNELNRFFAEISLESLAKRYPVFKHDDVLQVNQSIQ